MPDAPAPAFRHADLQCSPASLHSCARLSPTQTYFALCWRALEASSVPVSTSTSLAHPPCTICQLPGKTGWLK